MGVLNLEAFQPGKKLINIQKYGRSGGSDGRGILADIKADELPDETLGDFSNAPYEFEETALLVKEDVQRLYYHAGTANRFSENYLKYCSELERYIRQAGSFCITKAVLEQKGFKFPKLEDLSILELIRMVSFHIRKCHAAINGLYQDNDKLGFVYFQWELRWINLGERLKATEVKIRNIREGQLNVESMLKQEEVFRNEKKTSDRPYGGQPESLRVNPSALPLQGSMAREMIRLEREAAKDRIKKLKQEERAEREMMRDLRENGFAPPAPFRQARLPERAPMPKTEAKKAPEPDPRFDASEETISEAEVRKTLMEDAMKRSDQESLMKIPLEDPMELLDRWMRYIGRAPAPSISPGKSEIPDDTRKKLREKRKKKRK